MTTWLTRCFAGLLLVLPFVPAVADDPDDKEIARLVKQLGSSDFRTRQAATKRLEEIGEPALDALDKAAASSDDLEIRQRASRLIQAIAPPLQILCYEGHSERVMGVAFSPDGRRIVSACNDGTVRLIEVSTGKLIHSMAHPFARSVAVSPDGKKAVSTGEANDQTVRLWDLETGKEMKLFKPSAGCISGVAFSADGKRVLFGGFSDKTARLPGAQAWVPEVPAELKFQLAVARSQVPMAVLPPLEPAVGPLISQ